MSARSRKRLRRARLVLASLAHPPTFTAMSTASLVRWRQQIPQRHADHQGQPGIQQFSRPPLAEEEQHGHQHHHRADHAHQAAIPLSMAIPTDGIGDQCNACKQRQQRGEKQAFVATEDAKTRRSAKARQGREACWARRGRDDAAQGSGFVGKPCDPFH
ncbi:unnamed protein product [Brugia timori]|uniref:Secreted protein n=1 Tax=Brugia timori TaxID=42155 RepID=A0A0R3RAE8_9BILA|nr:unnamed protein product [Brugia timori]